MLRREDGQVLIKAYNLDVGQWQKGKPVRTWKKQVEEEGMNVGQRRDVHFID